MTRYLASALFASFLAFMLPLGAQAQVTTEQVQIGFLATTGCPSGQAVCFIPYSSGNPLPVSSGSGGGGAVTQGTVPWVDSITTWGGGTLGAPSNYGTSPGAVLVPGVNAFVTNFPATQPVSAASLPLPTGAATAANQNAALAATGGVATFARLVSSAATTNLTAIKTSAGRIYKIYGCNTSSTAAFIRFYNIASGSVTVGTSAVTFSREFPAMQCASYDFSDLGAYMSNATGFSFAITGANPDSDTTALTAGQMVQVEVAYQ